MRFPVKLSNMDTGEIIVAGISSFGAITIGGITAIIKQAKLNSKLILRVEALEEQKEDIREIKDSIVDIRINLAEDSSFRRQDNESIATVLNAISRIDKRIDNLTI